MFKQIAYPELGFRTNGSHYRMGKKSRRTTVPVHGKKDLGKGLIKAIERQTGVKLQ